jgi:hypothetical protein
LNIDTLVDILFDSCVADASLLSWCNTNYSSPQTIYKGIDLRNPPPQTDYPIIHIWPVNKVCGYSLGQKAHGIGVVCGVFDDTLSTETDTNLVVQKKYRGYARIEAFRKLVEDAVITELGSNTDTKELFTDTLEISYETIDSFPFFLAVNMFIFNENYSQGEDVFE